MSEDAGKTWHTAEQNKYPEEGVVVRMAYPAGTNAADYDFVVTHMYTANQNEFHAGDVETPPVVETEEGLQFTVHSLSPIAVSWKATPKTGNNGTDNQTPASTPTAETKQPDYYNCPNCGGHDWTAVEGGYRCDQCGYLETTKQLSGYSNVKGVYTPVTGSSSSTGTMPQTGDDSDLLLWILLLAVCGAGNAGLVLYRRKKQKR